jgi:hypothetical protein
MDIGMYALGAITVLLGQWAYRHRERIYVPRLGRPAGSRNTKTLRLLGDYKTCERILEYGDRYSIKWVCEEFGISRYMYKLIERKYNR